MVEKQKGESKDAAENSGVQGFLEGAELSESAKREREKLTI